MTDYQAFLRDEGRAATDKGMPETAKMFWDTAREMGRLQAIDDKLEKTADGVEITLGMTLWCEWCRRPASFEVYVIDPTHCGDADRLRIRHALVFSTPEAMEKAKEKTDG